MSEVCREATLKGSETAIDLPRSPATSTRYYNVITVMGPLRAAYGCTHAKTPHAANTLVTGSSGTSYRVPPAGFEPAHTAPEAVGFPRVFPGQKHT
ncbi:hypothetical protein GCM10010094_10220 [Streptomyces flaveus]|uniref:Uncharacterized protein n=1 Tax=Streptomyces flaveus TaxID=66370 RepID=A0A917V930_9ACTN|nr:hypothetical protein GCM10010094_10220 [Streptomyces flaveus]